MMHPQTVTLDELKTATARYDAEAVLGELTTERYRMKYVRWGQGPAIVFIHGLCDLPRSFAMVMAKLMPDFECIGICLPDGRGDGANLGMYRHTDYAKDVAALLDWLRISEANLVGSSFGSTVALRTAMMFPNQIRRVILQGGFARRPLSRVERGLARLGRYWPWLMGDLPIRTSVMRKYEQPAFVSAPPEVFEFLLANSGQTPIRAASRRGLILTTLDLRSRLNYVKCPVRLIGGDRDTIVPRMYEAELETGLPIVSRVEYSPCGHYPQYTHPGAMANEIRAFIRSKF